MQSLGNTVINSLIITTALLQIFLLAEFSNILRETISTFALK